MKKLVAMVLASACVMAVGASVASAAVDSGYVGTGSFGAAGTNDGEFTGPKHVAVQDSTGNVFVVDSGNNRIEVFKPNGSGSADFLTQFGSSTLITPTGIAVDESNGDVYVSDAGNNRIVRFDNDGAPTPSFSVDAGFTSPKKGSASGKLGSFADALAVDPTNGDLLVADPGHNVVYRYDSTGAFKSDFDGTDSPDGTFSGLLDVAVDAAGKAYVVDSTGDPVFGASSRVLRFSSTGVYDASLSDIPNPGVVAVDPNTGYVLVGGHLSAFSGSRIYVFNGTSEITDLPYPADNSGTITGLAVDGGAGQHLYAVGDQVFGCCGFVGVQVLQTAPLPDATADAPSSITQTGAHLTGTVNPLGIQTSWHFEYSTDGNFWTPVDGDQDAGSGTSNVSVATDAPGLQPNTSYRVRLVATTSAGAARHSNEQTFTTLAVPQPDVTIDPPSGVTGHDATFSGTVNPHGAVTVYRFEYSTDGTTWTSTTASDSAAGSGTTDLPVTGDVHVLVPGTGYHVRLVATNAGGETTSGEQTFTTDALAPSVSMTLAPTRLQSTSVELNAAVNPNNAPTTYYFEYGPTAAYGTSEPAAHDADAGAGSDSKRVSEQITGLQPGTTYHYTVVAHNQTGTTTGDDKTFTAPTSDTQITGLPDNRRYEMVSPPAKNGNDVLPLEEDTIGAADGNRAAFSSLGAFGDAAKSTGVTQQYVATRGAAGWSTHSPLPRQNIAPGADHTRVQFFTPNLERWALVAGDPEPLSGAETGRQNLYLGGGDAGLTRLTPTGTQHIVTTAGMSDDGRHVVFVAHTALTPDAPIDEASPAEDGANVYESVEGSLRLVNVLPNGTPVGGCAGRYSGGASTGGSGLCAIDHPLFFGDTDYGGAQHVVSSDGSHIFWTSVPDGQLYVRIDGSQTIHVSASQRTVPDPLGTRTVSFLGATPSGSKVLFTSDEKLTDNSTATQGNSDLYEFDVANGQLMDLSVDPITGESARVLGIVGLSDDGSSVYFVARGHLAPQSGPVDDLTALGFARPKVYRWHNGDVHWVTTLDDDNADSHNWVTNNRDSSRPSRVSPDGQYALFLSGLPLTGEGTAGHAEFYRYDAVLDQLACVSCPPGGQAATADAHGNGGQATSGTSQFQPVQSRLMSSDGSRVFFETREALVPGDANGRTDVYEWQDGKHLLISPGRSANDAHFADASSTGDDVFFTTYDRLTGADRDTNMDLYDARVGGGFPESPGPASCSGDGCAGAASPAPTFASPASSSVFLTDAGTPSASGGGKVTLTVAAISARGRKAFARSGRVTLRIRASAAGSVTVTARGRIGRKSRTVARTTKRVAAARSSSVTLQLSKSAMRELRRRHRWTLKVSVAMAGAQTKSATVTLTRTGR